MTEWTNGPISGGFGEGLDHLTHIIRSPDDPERRDVALSLGGSTDGMTKKAGLRAIKKLTVAHCAGLIAGLLADGRPRTFNAICVELWDRTADVLWQEVPDRALWFMVACGELEHTLKAPILFRPTT